MNSHDVTVLSLLCLFLSLLLNIYFAVGDDKQHFPEVGAIQIREKEFVPYQVSLRLTEIVQQRNFEYTPIQYKLGNTVTLNGACTF